MSEFDLENKIIVRMQSVIMFGRGGEISWVFLCAFRAVQDIFFVQLSFVLLSYIIIVNASLISFACCSALHQLYIEKLSFLFFLSSSVLSKRDKL